MTKLRVTLLLLTFAFLVTSRPSLSASLASTTPALCAANSSTVGAPPCVLGVAPASTPGPAFIGTVI